MNTTEALKATLNAGRARALAAVRAIGLATAADHLETVVGTGVKKPQGLINVKPTPAGPRLTRVQGFTAMITDATIKTRDGRYYRADANGTLRRAGMKVNARRPDESARQYRKRVKAMRRTAV